MKPNFALSLYFDKVELLHRGEDAWTSVGEVAFDSPDLSVELSNLRKTALTLDPAGLRTKLVLPDEQVKFLSLPEPNADTAAVRSALEDATPYALDDLVWEHTSDGRRTHVAAVARETLAEAEAFAVEHRFAPVSVVAQKVVGRFDGEPFFGETMAAAGLIGPDEAVERDDPPEALAPPAAPDPRMQEASPPKPEPEPETAPEPEPEKVEAKAEAKAPEPAETKANETPAAQSTKAELPAESPSEPVSPVKTETPAEPKAAKPPVKDPLDAFAATAKPVEPAPKAVGPAVQDDAPAPKAAFEPVPETPPGAALAVAAAEEPKVSTDTAPTEPVFASRSRQARTSGDGPATSDPLTVAMGTVRTDTPAPAPNSEVRAEPRIEPQTVPSRAAPGNPPPAVAERLARVAKANITADRIADMPPAKVARVPSRPSGNGAVAPAPVMPTEIPAPAAAKALAATLTPEEPETAPATGGLFSSRRQAEPAPAPRRGPPPVKVAPYPGEATATPQEQRGMTVFDQRADVAQSQRGRSRLILPILLAILLLFMAGVAAFAAIFTEHGIAGLFGRSGGDPILTATPSDTTPLDVPGTPSVASALDVLLPAASDPEIGQQANPEQLALVASPQGAALDPEVTADPVAAEDEIAQADPVVTPDTPQGTVLSPAEAERFYAATGVWLRAPRLPFIPTAEELGAVSTGDTVVAVTERVVLTALVAPREGNDDVAPPVQLDPPAADVVFERDSRGLLIASAEGTLTPYGMLIYAGLPGVVPPTRPGTPLPEPEIEPAAETVTEPVAPPVEDDIAVAEATQTEDTITEDTVTEDVVADDPAADVAATLEALVAESLVSNEPEPEIEPETESATSTEIATLSETEAVPEAVTDTPEVAPEAVDEDVTVDVDVADGGLVTATPEGAVTPEGVVVFAGLPNVVPPSRPEDLTPETAAADTPVTEGVETEAVETAETAEPLDTAIEEAIAEAVTEQEEDVTAGGVSLTGLSAGLRPVLRPDTLEVPAAAEVLASFAGPRPELRPDVLPGSLEDAAVEEEATEDPEIAETTVAATLAAIVASAPDPLAGATNSAVATAIIPEARPRNFAQVVAAAQARLASTVPQQTTTTTTTTTTQATAPEVVSSGVATPSGPIPQTVAGAATIESVINLREINLIGVFGRPNDRRALIRLANGQFVRVGVGDALDGGQVTAIGDNVINYVKRGRTIALGVPG